MAKAEKDDEKTDPVSEAVKDIKDESDLTTARQRLAMEADARTKLLEKMVEEVRGSGKGELRSELTDARDEERVRDLEPKAAHTEHS